MDYPKNCQEAAKVIKALALAEKISASAYCLARGISPAVLYNWETRNKGFRGDIFERLIAKVKK